MSFMQTANPTPACTSVQSDHVLFGPPIYSVVADESVSVQRKS